MNKKKLILSAAILTLISFSALGCSSTGSSAPFDPKTSSDTSAVSPAVSPTSAPSKTSSDAESKDKLTNKEDDNVKEESDDEEYYDTSEEDNYDNENTSASSSNDSGTENNIDVPEYDPAKTNPEEEGWAEFEDKY